MVQGLVIIDGMRSRQDYNHNSQKDMSLEAGAVSWGSSAQNASCVHTVYVSVRRVTYS